MAITQEQIKALPCKERVREAFKEVRRRGYTARMGVAWSQRRQITTKPKYIFYEDYQRNYFHMDGTLHHRIHCEFKDNDAELLDIIRAFGIDLQLHGSSLTYGYVDIIGVKDENIAALPSSKDHYEATYTID